MPALKRENCKERNSETKGDVLLQIPKINFVAVREI